MRINSKILGEIEIEGSGIIDFPAGIPAFEEERQFVIIPLDGNGPFYYLQAVNHSELCLLIVDPFVFFPDYKVDVPDEQLKKIQSQSGGESISLLSVLTVPEDFREATANLFAPLIIDTESKLGMQFIPQNSNYVTRHKIFPDEQRETKAAAGQGE